MVSNRFVEPRDAFDVMSENGEWAVFKQVRKRLMVACKVGTEQLKTDHVVMLDELMSTKVDDSLIV